MLLKLEVTASNSTKKKRFSHDVKKYSFSNRLVNPWNNLSDHIITAPSLNSFKSRLNNLWKPRNKTLVECRLLHLNRVYICIDIAIFKCQ